MKTKYQLSKRFREVILNGTFIANTNYRDQLEGLDWQLATKQVGSLNSIAILAQHIHYYIEGVKNAFKEGKLAISDQYSFDFPEIISSEEWRKFLDSLWQDSIEFALLIEQMPEERLDEFFIDEKYGTYLLNIESMIEHCYYHLGQIVLLKKYLVSKT